MRTLVGWAGTRQARLRIDTKGAIRRQSFAIPAIVATLQRAGRWLTHAVESTAGAALFGALTSVLVLLVGMAATVASSEPWSTAGLSVASSAGLGILVGSRPGRTGPVAAMLAVGLLSGFVAVTFGLAPTVVWLFAFVVPALGITKGPRTGALAGFSAAMALHWIETGALLGNIDLQMPFGMLILTALGWLPGHLLRIARTRQQALDTELVRVAELLEETKAARSAEADARHQAVFMLARAAEARDGTTGAHLHSVRDLARELALARGIPGVDADEIAWSAMLHDVGKLRVPDRVLLKRGPLSTDERALIEAHPTWGEELLRSDEGFALARTIARSHHEDWDGGGYPDHLRGEDIPLAARIVRVVDVYDALLSERPYKPAWPEERALDEIRAMRGRAFDPELTDLFLGLRS